MKQTPADRVFKMLAFQYQPLEAQMFEVLRECEQEEQIAIYQNMDSAKKIMILDRFASEFLNY